MGSWVLINALWYKLAKQALDPVAIFVATIVQMD
jgi:hypothetical protein